MAFFHLPVRTVRRDHVVVLDVDTLETLDAEDLDRARVLNAHHTTGRNVVLTLQSVNVINGASYEVTLDDATIVALDDAPYDFLD